MRGVSRKLEVHKEWTKACVGAVHLHKPADVVH